jgi:hypothetical protein
MLMIWETRKRHVIYTAGKIRWQLKITTTVTGTTVCHEDVSDTLEAERHRWLAVHSDSLKESVSIPEKLGREF